MVSTAEPVAQMGVKPLIYGTLWVSFGAILLALPIICSHLFMRLQRKELVIY
jgi:ABC-type phosphate transport system permease subunit